MNESIARPPPVREEGGADGLPEQGSGTGLFDLSGKVALVTGATGGLGRAIASAFASHGARVVVSDRDAGPCVALATGLSRPGAPPAVALAAAAFMQRRLAMTPLRRVGEPHEVAGVAVMLASAAGGFVTGQNIVVDGGTLISDGS